ncbi:hypothetical protein [Actinopolymorpha pittospori]|uniref:Uncharacterized protein n=1 Tax=Actinopolymorpha pittospori TaxID=648752 RepID=A0A927N2P1_9ACTN|nr:hypothetical protein [Actinopolymorpha pittospori]MBE1607827.1 hypothetical protein [Actinopolymorpha pittospori]
MPYPLTLQPHRESAAVSSPPAEWAGATLSGWLATAEPGAGVTAGTLTVLGLDSPGAADLWRTATDTAPDAAESFVVTRDPEDRDGLVLIGSDGNGVAYGLLEILDQLQCTGSVQIAELPLVASPSNRVRGIFRSYVSKVEDAGWYLDRGFWDSYLTELASHRFNRLQLAFGIGVEYGHDPGVTENYLLFSYPFLVDLPEFPVRVVDLPAAERQANLDALRYASSEAARRGIEFFVGFWTNGVELDDGIEGECQVEGITPENHAAYSAAAIRTILEECPGISGVTLRVHYESGIPEPAEEFWRTVFEGIGSVGRRVSVDLHSKGLHAGTIAAAREAGLEVLVTAKFLAEHLSLPYHQTAIRASEMPIENVDANYAGITQGARRFTRYGYGDYLRRERDYRVVYRHWPGTQRLLLWGDPEFAAGYGRIASFGGAEGAEFFEPLSYKGRKGSGSAEGRQVYRDPHLAEGGEEWRKYRYHYRLLGRLLYDPEADSGQWRRLLDAEFGPAARDAERSLALASRILPLVTLAHGVSAANSVYWPEMYENLGIANGGSPNEYYVSDSKPPHTFGSAASLDPEVFTTIREFVDQLLKGEADGRVTTFDVARRLDALAEAAQAHLDAFAAASGEAPTPAVSRWIVDVRAQVGLGRFFADKLRTGVGYELFERTGSADYLRYAVDRYNAAAEHWREVVEATSGYKTDLAFGKASHLRGHWADRQESLDRDVHDLRAELERASEGAASTLDLAALESDAGEPAPAFAHEPVTTFRPGEEVTLTLVPAAATGVGAGAEPGLEVVVRYRHANQGENYREATATRTDAGWVATIPAEYTDSPFDLLYFFRISAESGAAWHFPGLAESLANPPYFVVRAVTR